MNKFKYLSGLVVECSRLLQSFTEKVKTGARPGTQYKQIEKPDWSLEILKQYAPEAYEKYYKATFS